MQKEHWYEKYRKDTDEKTQELEQLKAMRNKDLERMQELTVKVSFEISCYIVVLLLLCQRIKKQVFKCFCIGIKNYNYFNYISIY